ncbi:MAG: hypothetical protein JXB07_17985 [Anaerolineae bacterium]|nr:hypothetical protein [Anaerolineae bacterium]
MPDKVDSAYILVKHLKSVHDCFWAGVLLSLIGFALPWFWFARYGRDCYISGLTLVIDYGFLSWFSLIVASYVVLFLLGFDLLGLSLRRDGWVALLSLVATLGTLISISVAAADAGAAPALGIGLLIMLPGHALLLFGAFASWTLRAMHEVFGLPDKVSL